MTGIKVGVPYCAEAGRVLLPVSFASPEDGGTGVVIIDPAAAGAHADPHPVRRAAGPSTRCGSTALRSSTSSARPAAWTTCTSLAVAGACCLADGALAAALELTRDHVAQRHQFGRPLASFQAVAQQIADVYIASRTLHLATLSACWRLDTGRDAGGDLGGGGVLVRGRGAPVRSDLPSPARRDGDGR